MPRHVKAYTTTARIVVKGAPSATPEKKKTTMKSLA
jgi:hypothetical protein